MSASWALIRFAKTGNVYFGCYEGNSDTMNPYICTPEECWSDKTECYCSIAYCREFSLGKDWIFPEDAADLDSVEIYSDYGAGFYWSAYGSESTKMLYDPLDEWGEPKYGELVDGMPEWARTFIDSIV